MSIRQVIGVAAFDRDGSGYDQVGAVLVYGPSKKDWFQSVLRDAGESDLLVREVYADEIFESLSAGGASVAFDGESFRLFDPHAIARYCTPTGTFEFGFYDDRMEIFIIFSPSLAN